MFIVDDELLKQAEQYENEIFENEPSLQLEKEYNDELLKEWLILEELDDKKEKVEKEHYEKRVDTTKNKKKTLKEHPEFKVAKSKQKKLVEKFVERNELKETKRVFNKSIPLEKAIEQKMFEVIEKEYKNEMKQEEQKPEVKQGIEVKKTFEDIKNDSKQLKEVTELQSKISSEYLEKYQKNNHIEHPFIKRSDVIAEYDKKTLLAHENKIKIFYIELENKLYEEKRKKLFNKLEEVKNVHRSVDNKSFEKLYRKKDKFDNQSLSELMTKEKDRLAVLKTKQNDKLEKMDKLEKLKREYSKKFNEEYVSKNNVDKDINSIQYFLSNPSKILDKKDIEKKKSASKEHNMKETD